MKILLISANTEHLPDPVFPLGAAYVAGALEQAGHNCHCLDLCFSNDPQQITADALKHLQPDLVALALRNVDNVSYPRVVSYLPLYQALMTTIRQHSGAPVVLGGSGFTLLPDELFKYLKADYGIAGEGEIALPRLVRHLSGEAPLSQDNLPILRPDRYRVEGLDGLPFPARAHFDSRRYLRSGGMGNLQTKRGCPFDCIYCTYPLIEGRSVRMRSPEAICDEIKGLSSMGIETLFITDNEFNFPMEHALAVCRALLRHRIRIKWSAYVNPAHISRELLDIMQAAGCTGIEFGTDAACPAMLRSLRKNFGIQQIQTAGRLCAQAGMPFCHALLLGGPGETPATVQRSVDAIAAQNPTAVICMVGIRIYPGTRLAAIARAEGLVKDDSNFLEPIFYLAESIKDSILTDLAQFSQKHPTWIFPGLQINMNAALQSKLRRFGKQGPLWENMRPTKTVNS